jgi:hypothetical protein
MATLSTSSKCSHTTVCIPDTLQKQTGNPARRGEPAASEPKKWDTTYAKVPPQPVAGSFKGLSIEKTFTLSIPHWIPSCPEALCQMVNEISVEPVLFPLPSSYTGSHKYVPFRMSMLAPDRAMRPRFPKSSRGAGSGSLHQITTQFCTINCGCIKIPKAQFIRRVASSVTRLDARSSVC